MDYYTRRRVSLGSDKARQAAIKKPASGYIGLASCEPRADVLWDCVSHICGGGGGCAGGGVPLGAVLVLSWCGELSLGGILIIISSIQSPPTKENPSLGLPRE